MNFSAPQVQNTLNPYQYSHAIAWLANTNRYDGITKWLENQGKSIADRNAIEAQDYFKNLSLDDITKAKEQGRDILKEYAKDRWFFDPTNAEVRQARDTRSQEESDYALEQFKRQLVKEMNSDNAKGGNTRRIWDTLGFRNRKAEEYQTAENALQDAWVKRYKDNLMTQAGNAYLQDPTGALAAEQYQKALNDNNIYKLSAGDLNQESVKPYLTRAADEQVNDVARRLASSNDISMQDLEGYNRGAAMYAPYASPEALQRLTGEVARRKGGLVNQAIQEVYSQLSQDPQFRAETEKLGFQHTMLNYVIPAVANKIGVTPEEVMRIHQNDVTARSTYLGSMTSSQGLAAKTQAEQNLTDVKEGNKALYGNVYDNVYSNDLIDFGSEDANKAIRSNAFKTDVGRLFDDRGLTQVFDNIANLLNRSNTGRQIGYQILTSYMKQHGETDTNAVISALKDGTHPIHRQLREYANRVLLQIQADKLYKQAKDNYDNSRIHLMDANYINPRYY